MATLSQIKASDNITYNIRDDVSTWGGRNLMVGTNDWSCMENVTGLTKNGEECSIATNNTKNRTFYLPVNNNETYTAGVDVKVSTPATYIQSSDLYFLIDELDSSNTRVTYERSPTADLTTSWQRITITFTISDPNIAKISFGFRNNTSSSNDTVTMRHLKIEQSNKATDWTPAPEDIAKFIGDETIELYSE